MSELEMKSCLANTLYYNLQGNPYTSHEYSQYHSHALHVFKNTLITITNTIVQSCIGSLVMLLVFHAHNNTDSKKLEISLFIILYLTHANIWESMGKPCSCTQFIKSRIFCCKSHENPYQYYKSRENPYQVLQVTRAASEHAMKLKVRMIKSLSP